VLASSPNFYIDFLLLNPIYVSAPSYGPT